MLSLPLDIERTVTIEKCPSEVFKAVFDFTNWPNWSPWLNQEPSCPVTIKGGAGDVGHSQAWDGDIIGSGNMHIVKADNHEVLEYDLHFLKPWKSNSKVGFRFTPDGNSTNVTWWMKGTLPIFLFFMKKTMSSLVGYDYDRGLSMLKEYIETGAINTDTEIKGVIDRESLHYFGKRNTVSFKEIGPTMEKDLAELGGLLASADLPQPEQVFSMYHTWDMVKGTCDYTAGFLYDSPQQAKEGFEHGQLAAHKALRVDHKGPYRHLGNAWSAAMGYVRSRHKTNKAVPTYEIYSNNPQEVSESDLQTQVYIPIKR